MEKIPYMAFLSTLQVVTPQAKPDSTRGKLAYKTAQSIRENKYSIKVPSPCLMYKRERTLQNELKEMDL